MPTVTQEQINRFFEIIAASKLVNELTELNQLDSDTHYFTIQKGQDDALKIKPSKVRGFLGTYNATTNTPSLSNLTGIEGDSYKVSVSGTVNFGAGAVKMAVGDIIEFRNGIWTNKTENASISEHYFGTVTTAGQTTTNTEIEDFINNQGFSISINQIKVLKATVYINNILHTKTWLYSLNLAGSYNTGNAISFSELIELSTRIFDPTYENTTIISLGDIAPETTIEDFINANDSVEWDLQAGIMYLFSLTESAVNYTYLYIGTQPQYIGLSQTAVTSNDFYLIETNDKIWYWIDGSEVRKTGGTNYSSLESGDTVRFKPITNGGFPVTIPYGIYNGGDDQDSGNYTVPTLLQ